MTKVVISPFGNLQPSKHRNSKKQSLTFVDNAGHKITGNPSKHFMQVAQKQQARFDTKFEAFSLLKKEELQELYLNPDKTKIKSSTDKLALENAYFNTCFNEFKAQNKEDLESIKGNTLDNLNDVQKRALNAAIDIKEKELLTKNNKNEK